MANLLGTDRLIVDRGGQTFKALFSDIESSLDLEGYTLQSGVDVDLTGVATEMSVVDGGDKFIVGAELASIDGKSIITVTSLVGDELYGAIEEFNIVSGGYDYSVGDTAVFEPFTADGKVYDIPSVDFSGVAVPEQTWTVVQGTFDPATGPADDANTSCTIQVSDVSGSPKVTKILNQGFNYDKGDVIGLKTCRGTYDINGDWIYVVGPVVNISVGDEADNSGSEATLQVDEVVDTTDAAYIRLVKEDTGEVKGEVLLRPGVGINITESNSSDLGETIYGLLISATGFGDGDGGDGGSISTSSSVIVSSSPPTREDGYSLTSGSLWYNTVEGRLYVNNPIILGPSASQDNWISTLR